MHTFTASTWTVGNLASNQGLQLPLMGREVGEQLDKHRGGKHGMAFFFMRVSHCTLLFCVQWKKSLCFRFVGSILTLVLFSDSFAYDIS